MKPNHTARVPLPAPRNTHARLWGLALAAVSAPFAAGCNASVYKCAGADGAPVYQEFACPAGKELRNFDTDPPALSIIPAPEAAPDGRARKVTEKPGPRKTAGGEPSARKTRGDPAERRHAHTGMSEGEVMARLGRPDITAGGGRKGKSRWTYLPTPGDPDTITTLYIDRGAVVDIERKLMKR
ncbi:MAG: DUF4124 domain-containing protein [Betaproteobacteria bacterium]